MKRLTTQTGMVIAIGRVVLALAFLLALWIDPAISVKETAAGNILIISYLVWATGLMAVAAKSWWFDHRMAAFAQGVDIAMFVTAIYLTESSFSEFQSPFLALAAFLLISAMMRWNWQATVITAMVLLAANIALASLLYYTDLHVEPFRLLRRILYMILLSGILIWLSVSRGGGRTPVVAEQLTRYGSGTAEDRRARLVAGLLADVSNLIGAEKVALALAPSEEPWIELWQPETHDTAKVRRGPYEYDPDVPLPCPVALFCRPKARALVLEGDDIVATRQAELPGLTRFLNVDEGIVAPVESAIGSGQLLLWDIQVASADSLPMAKALAMQIGRALDREEMAMLAQHAAEDNVRQALARDLHDSVAQFLAGTLFRIEALRRWISEGNDPEPEIFAIKNALRREQGQLRQLIDNLRRGEDIDRQTEIADELRDLMNEAGAHWHVETRLQLPDQPVPVSVKLSHEIRQLVREGVANAVRHGECSQVTVALTTEAGQLRLSIRDNGKGFPADIATFYPRSIRERVDALGGKMHIDTSDAGTDLTITFRSGDAE